MNFLFTGVPGSTKTLNAIKLICEDSQLKNRPVYYYNLNGCSIPGWTELSEDEAKKWYLLPVGSVIFFDEAQTIFRPVARDRTKSETYTKLETSRHDGFDIVMTTQHPMFLDTHVRRNTHIHHHFERPFATTKPRRLTWQKAIDDPDDYHKRQEAEKTRLKMDKSYFGKYQSTELNTHKPRISKKLIGVVALTLAVLGLGLHFYFKKTGEHEALVTQATGSATQVLPAEVAPAASTHQFKPKYPMDPKEYLEIFKPRVAGMPATAPAYDHLMEPTEAPKTLCYAWHREGVRHCKCVTQQITPVEVGLSQCLNTVDNRMWDPVSKPQAYNSRGRAIDPVM